MLIPLSDDAVLVVAVAAVVVGLFLMALETLGVSMVVLVKFVVVVLLL